MASNALVAIGIVSAPLFFERRMGIRSSWLRWANVGRNAPIHVCFVVRAKDAPLRLQQLLDAEATSYMDLLKISVNWNESRLKGPVLSLAAWLSHASRHYRSTPFVAKMDDDAYLHAPDLERLLRMAVGQRQSMLYLGKLAWFHWHPDIFEQEGFGWTYGQAYESGRRCRNATPPAVSAPCTGPFPFATGFLMLLSMRLAASVVEGAQTDARHLAQTSAVRKR